MADAEEGLERLAVLPMAFVLVRGVVSQAVQRGALRALHCPLRALHCPLRALHCPAGRSTTRASGGGARVAPIKGTLLADTK